MHIYKYVKKVVGLDKLKRIYKKGKVLGEEN